MNQAKMRGHLAIKLVDPSRIISRIRYADHDGRPSFDRIQMYREAWALAAPQDQFNVTFSADGDVVEFCAPPGWTPPDYSIAAGACLGFTAPVAFPAPAPPCMVGSMGR